MGIISSVGAFRLLTSSSTFQWLNLFSYVSISAPEVSRHKQAQCLLEDTCQGLQSRHIDCAEPHLGRDRGVLCGLVFYT